ncbi:MAG: flgK [Actinomycetia bacterium]|nr:flgK [Actinomycetes bacterium]
MTEMAGLQRALSALYAQRRGLEVVGENVANANTDGYSRQSVNLQEISGPSVPSIWSKYDGVGSGVKVADITRFRDQFLEIRSALEHGASGQLGKVSNTLSQLETLFGEPSDTGIQSQLTQVWTGFDDVANAPSDIAARTQLLQRATTLANTINSTAAAITSMSKSAVSELTALTANVNAKAGTVAQLNDAIKNRLVNGLSANDLLDQRDKLASELAGQIGATIRPGTDGQVTLAVGGTALVYGSHAETLDVDSSNPTVVLRWHKDNFPAAVSSGEAGGLMQVVNQTLPQYLSGLDAIAVHLRNDVNGLHNSIGGGIAATAQNQSAAGNLTFQLALNGGAYATATVAGADWSGAGGAAALQTALQTSVNAAVGAGNATVTVTGGSGQPLKVSLVPTGTNKVLIQASAGNAGFATLLGSTAVGLDGIGGRDFFSGTNAATFSVSSAVAGNTSAVAAGTVGNGPLDNSVALQAAELGGATAGADAQYRAYIVSMGVDSQTTQQRDSIQQKTTDAIDNQRDSNASVNTDEEMVNLVAFQRGYEASARVMTTIDEMLNTLINNTGVR